MRHFLFLVALICCNPNLFCQIDTTSTKSDTVFYKIELGFLTSTKRENAEGFGFKSPYNPQNYTKKIKYLQSETPMVSYECYDKKYITANVESTMTLNNGLYEEWYLSGEKRVSCYYKDDKLDGAFKVFHKNGKLKRSEIWVSGEWKSGECFDENGTKIPYCSYPIVRAFFSNVGKKKVVALFWTTTSTTNEHSRNTQCNIRKYGCNEQA